MAKKISQLPAAAALTGAEQVPAVQGGATVQLPIGAIHTPDYISGLKMVWNSANSLSVTSGAAYISSLGRVVRLGAAANLAGLVLAASTWYHLYLYLNAGAPAIECVPTAPAAAYYGTARTKTGDTSRRYIGSVVTDASGNLLKFSFFNNQVFYLEKLGVREVLVGGQATTATPFSVAPLVPVTASAVMLCANNADTSVLAVVDSADMNYSPGTARWMEVPTQDKFTFPIPVPSSQNLSYYYSATPTGALYVEVVSYFFDR